MSGLKVKALNSLYEVLNSNIITIDIPKKYKKMFFVPMSASKLYLFLNKLSSLKQNIVIFFTYNNIPFEKKFFPSLGGIISSSIYHLHSFLLVLITFTSQNFFWWCKIHKEEKFSSSRWIHFPFGIRFFYLVRKSNFF